MFNPFRRAIATRRMKPARFLHLIAHRGDAASCPENTLPAFQSALDLGLRFVEVDVQISANGVPVAVRDSSVRVQDTTVPVAELTAAELGQVDASQPHRFGDRFRGTGIARLVDVLSRVTKRAETTVFVTLGRASVVHFGYEQAVAQVAEAIKPFRSRSIFVCEDVPAIHRARQLSGLQIGWVLPAYDAHTRIKCEALQPDYVFCERSLLPAGTALWRGPWRWVVRDVTTLEHALALAALGADFAATLDARALGDAMRAHALAQAAAHATAQPPAETRPADPQIGDESTTIARTTLVSLP